MSDHLSFVISRGEGNGPAEFYLHERCWHEYGRIDSVRACLEHHRAALAERLEALDSILSADIPEVAERCLFDDVHVRVNEVTLRSPSTAERFASLMRAISGDKRF